jgi:DNA-binding MarR family transcriptional regulator
MSDDRHTSVIPIIPHRTAPPSEKEIFGTPKKLSAIEIGLLQMQILWMLNRKSTHGYEIMDTLNKIKSTKIAQGTMYPTLKNLRKYGYIKGERVDDRIIYHITGDGKRVLNETCLDFTRTFFGIFQDFVCHKCVGHADNNHIHKK